MEDKKFTKYEKARILGARALQIAMNAPLLIKISEDDLQKINYDPIKIAEIELKSDVLPISIKKPFPEKKEGNLKRIVSQKNIVKKENKEGDEETEEDEGEIMELANPEDEEIVEESGDEAEGFEE